MDFNHFQVPYEPEPRFGKRVAYFSMEFAIHQPLKIYSGGLGFLAGSHLRSAYELSQQMIGIGILWKYGYYDQGRNTDNTMQVQWHEKVYYFLKDTGIKFTIKVHGSDVWVKALYLDPEVFRTAPLFLLTTDILENDYLSRTICHKLYDGNEATKLAQYILLGIGGAKLLDILNYDAAVYHLNEAHALPAAFYLLRKYGGNTDEVRQRMVFTTHTPEEAGNEKHALALCAEMGYFMDMPTEKVQQIVGMKPEEHIFNLTLTGLRLSRKANGVSQIHGEVAREMWAHYGGICPIISITNAQNWQYWADKQLYAAKENGNLLLFDDRKRYLKKRLFELVANQTGKIFNPDVCTVVWARRMAAYKRAFLILKDRERFNRLINNKKYPIQIIWAGKPYPEDTGNINAFNQLIDTCRSSDNAAVVTGYELTLSRRLKQGADLWLNTPRVPREASGTSGMTAAMNGSVNLSTRDGWIPEFIKDGENGFALPVADYIHMSMEEQDEFDSHNLYDLLENTILPLYYEQKEQWRKIVQQGMEDVRFEFDSNRMAIAYYDQLYNG